MTTKSLNDQHPATGDIIVRTGPDSKNIVARITKTLISSGGVDFEIGYLRHDGLISGFSSVRGDAQLGWEVRHESLEFLLGGLLNPTSPMASTAQSQPPSSIGPITHGDPKYNITGPDIKRLIDANSTGRPDASCIHEWVNVGFQFSKIICKKCEQENT